ncbi:MAG TPA: histidine kinase [Mariniphaga anaerophila]|uniref:Histidine kinase n=1 Tax=Mariniphaga anaerophila TaxID=1484053 RepID=A0A831LHT6_9BACT|nr:histidine kinase [Mariniphaga anaerophila]
MKIVSNISKILNVALYTSPLIGILAISPMFIIRMVPIQIYPRSVLSLTVIIFLAWMINISIIYFGEKFKIRNESFNILRYFLSYLLSASFIMFAMRMRKIFFSGIFTSCEITRPHSPLATFVMAISLNTVILIILDLILLKAKKTRIEIENAQLKQKNSEALYQQLKQQIHPHFLFNSLNTLKSLINKSPDIAEDYLIKLSDFLRTSVSAGNDNIVKLKEELKLCLDYLEMQKIRYGKALQFSVDIPEKIYQTGFVPVFSLQMLTENAIKHNALTNESPLQIQIKYVEGRITVINNLQPKLITETTTGSGLTNLAERYKILSGDEIIIRTTANQFSVSIKVLNNENSNY